MIALKKILKRHMFGAAVAALLFVGGVETAKAAEITITSGSAGQDFEIFKKLINDWSAKTGNTVKLFNTPNSTTDTLALLRQQFGAKSSEIDVLMVDVIWPGVIKQHLMDLKPYTKGSEKNHFPAIVANNTIDGKLLAMPWYIDAGLLYYRKDLLDKYREPVPATWEEMRATAQKIQDGERKVGNKEMQGYVFQGKTYEGLTCNALEWVSSYKGGSVIEGNGKISIDNPQAVKALDMAASWIGTISPRNVLSFTEEEARGVFQNGNSIFMRNWPYAWS
ncbi:MAG: extracellular solute-binding protein, partial [Candidatus Methylopumilus sp.]